MILKAMIQNLLTAITGLLHNELDQLLIDSGATIALHPSNWQISPTLRETTLPEFQQDFYIDISDQNYALLEQWSSLIVGILLDRHDWLIQQYNNPPNPTSKTEYQSENIITTHTLNHFRLLTGIFFNPPSPFGLRLTFTVTGQIRVTSKIDLDDDRIRTVTGQIRVTNKIDLDADQVREEPIEVRFSPSPLQAKIR
jgi:hypothetical protein